MINHSIISLAWCACCLALPAAEDGWPQEGGPGRTWVLPAQPMADAYPGGKLPVAWSAEVGLGKAAVAVADGRLYVYGQYRSGVDLAQVDDPIQVPDFSEIPKNSKGPVMSSRTLPEEPPGAEERSGLIGDLVVRCFDAASGRPLWSVRLPDPGMAYLSNAAFPLAAPLVIGDRVVIHTPTGRLYALAGATGAVLWRLSLYDHGMDTWTWKQCNGASPLAVGDLVVVAFLGRTDEASPKRRVRVAAFHHADGRPAWSTLLPFHIYRQHASSLGLMTTAAGPAVLVPCGSGTAAIDGRTGALRWGFDARADMPEVFSEVPAAFTGEAATMYRGELGYPYPGLAPMAWQGLVVDTTSVGHDSAASRTWCVDATGPEPRLLWQTPDFVPFNEMQRSNLLIHEGRLYGFDARGGWRSTGAPVGASGRPARGRGEHSFQCRDVRTGKLLWSTDALDGPGAEWQPSRLMIVGDRLITCTRRGITVSRLRSDGLEVLGGLESAGGSPVLSDPVVSGGLLYVRQITGTRGGQPWGPAAAAGVGASLLAIDLR